MPHKQSKSCLTTPLTTCQLLKTLVVGIVCIAAIYNLFERFLIIILLH